MSTENEIRAASANFYSALNRMAKGEAGAMESIVGRVMPAVSGVLIVEAVKQVYAIAAGKRVRKLSHRLRPALLPAPSTRTSIDPSGDRLLFPSRPL